MNISVANQFGNKVIAYLNWKRKQQCEQTYKKFVQHKPKCSVQCTIVTSKKKCTLILPFQRHQEQQQRRKKITAPT